MTDARTAADRATALDGEELLALGQDGAAGYASAAPFPHAVFDGLFDPAALAAVADEFPGVDDPRWVVHGDAEEAGKQEASDAAEWGPAVAGLIAELSSPPWLRFVEALTGFADLVPEAHGGGMHQSGPGARLGVHLDFNHHPDRELERLVNFIVYLNPGWTEEDGGALELWSETEPVRTVVPVFNRCVLFSSGDTSFHGHPVPVVAGRRRSVALYYYGRRPEGLPEQHGTVWLADPRP